LRATEGPGATGDWSGGVGPRVRTGDKLPVAPENQAEDSPALTVRWAVRCLGE